MSGEAEKAELNRQRRMAYLVTRSVEKVLDDQNISPGASIPVLLEWVFTLAYALAATKAKPSNGDGFAMTDKVIDAVRLAARKNVRKVRKI